MVSVSIDGYDYDMREGQDGRMWIHCPKGNRREKSWLTEEEVGRHHHASTLLKEKWAKKVQEDHEAEQHLSLIHI